MQTEPRVNILLVDDRPENLLALESILADLDQNLVKADSGREALRHLLHEDFAVVLLDVQMPEMDGFETATLIRSREKSRHTPIVFLTAINKSETHVSRGYSVGGVDYVFKPFDPDVLRAKVAAFVELSKKTQALQAEIVQREQAEAAVRRLSQDLERRVEERTAALAAANRELEQEIAERKRAEAEREQLLAREQAARITAEEAAEANEELVQALRASEEQYRFLAEAIPQIVWTARPDGYLDYYNRRWFEYTGLTAEQTFVKGGWGSVLHPDDIERCIRGWGEAVRTGQAYETEYRFKRAADGTYRWHLVRALPLQDGDGRVVRWFGTCTDIDDQKRAQQSLEFLAETSVLLAESLEYETTLEQVARLAVPRLADWCVVDTLEADGTLRRLALAHTEPAREEVAWELWRRYPPRPEDTAGVMEVLRTGQPELAEEISDAALAAIAEDEAHLRILRELEPQSYMIVPLVARGRTLGAISLIAAKSGRRYAAEDLALAEDLARRAATAIDNARLFREVQDADRAKDQFLAMLGHELRNPLAPIRSAVINMHLRGMDDPSLQRARDIIERQTEHMARLVDDLLDVARITNGRIELRKEWSDLSDVVERAVETTRPIIEARNHQLTVDCPPEPLWLEVDPVRLEQVLTNLLNNAAKYTDPGGKIWLSVEVEGDGLRVEGQQGPEPSTLNPQPSTAVIRVRDTGIGIPADLLPRVFDLFTQARDRLDPAQGGLGLGLTLVRSLVQMHGGSVAAWSEGAGKGSEFTVRLPAGKGTGQKGKGERRKAKGERRKAKGKSPSTSPFAFPPSPSRRVLVVDDNLDAAETLAEMLELWGHEVRVAHDGPAALKAVVSYEPEVVLLDIGLPGMDGYEVAQQLRKDEGGRRKDEGEPIHPSSFRLRPLLLVALTGYGQEEDRRRSREAGFDRHLTKPVDPAAIQEMLNNIEGLSDAPCSPGAAPGG
jgi:PAS domain S-box-containing protein